MELWFDNEELNAFQLAASDMIVFHNYRPTDYPENQTEWMVRTCGSLVNTHLPVFAREKIGCINWGLVTGKTNTIYQWKELEALLEPASLPVDDPGAAPKVWFHDLFSSDGTPYGPIEIELFRTYIGR